MRIYLYICLLFFSSCVSNPEKLTRDFDMGLIYWPSENTTDYDIKKGIHFTIENSDILTAQIPWEPNTNNLVNNLQWISNLAKTTNRKLIINVDWLNNNRSSLRGDKTWSFKDPIVKEKFIRSIITACRTYQPDYINLAVEINYLALINPNEFRYFLDVYNYSKSLIESLSPKTKIGVTFQLQLLLGTHESWSNNESLSVIKAFGGNYDYIGISTYPNLNLDKEVNIQQLKKIESISSKKIAIFETSVPTNMYSQSVQYIYQILLTTSDYYYIFKVKKDALLSFQLYLDYEPVKRIKRSMFGDNSSENVFMDEYGRFKRAELLFQDVDYDLDEEQSFTLTEGKDTYQFNFLNR